MDADTVDLYIFIGADYNVFDSANDPGLDEIRSLRGDPDGNIRGLDFKMAIVDNVLGVQFRLIAKYIVKFHAELGNVGLGNTAGR